MKPLTRSAYRVAAAIRDLAPEGPAPLTTPQIGELADCSRRTVASALDSLEQAGAITRTGMTIGRRIAIVPDHPLWALLDVMGR